MPRWAVPIVLVALGIGCLWQSQRRATSGPAPSPAPISTPILSARRAPDTIADLVASLRLSANLDASLAGSDGCLEVSLRGSRLFADSPSVALLPASNLKLLTAYAALAKLGPTSHFTTTVKASAAAVKGVVAGPLYLVGGGDPLLATASFRASQHEWTESAEPVTRLEALADSVKAAGITTVTGAVIGDDSRYDEQRQLPSWSSSYIAGGQIGSVGALVVNGGFSTPGHAAADPAQAAAAELTALLTARGVTVGGPPAAGTAPRDAVAVAQLSSLPLSDIVGEMLRESDNLAAEMLTKELGAQVGGAGTWPAGTKVISDAVAATGIPLAGLVQNDGSGLDRGDRLTCDTVASLLGLRTPLSEIIAASLPSGRVRNLGTPVRRDTGRGADPAKTGSLIGVAALSGFVTPARASVAPCPPGAQSAGPADMVFALLANNVASDAATTALEDRVADALASFPELPSTGPLGPR